MTIDERLEFLLQSTESLHTSVQDLTGTVDRISKTVEQVLRAVQADGENIRSLARIAEMHDHRRTKLEGNEGPIDGKDS